jgi:hypothetical protein
MKAAKVKSKPKRGTTRLKRVVKRDVFNEISEGFDAFVEARQGKRTLQIHAVEFKSAPNRMRRRRF